MKKALLTVAFVFVVAGFAKAQTPIPCADGGPCWSPAKVDIGATFAITNTSSAAASPISNFGFALDGAYFPFRSNPSKLINGWGLAADLSYTRSSAESLTTGMAGARYRYFLGDSWQVFGEALAGAARNKLTVSQSQNFETHLAYFMGAGLDAQFATHFSIRFIEAGFEQTIVGGKQTHSRISMGLKYSF